MVNEYFKNNTYKIGGKDLVVEVDESFLGKHKYNVGRIQNQKIILGVICRSTKQRFMQKIEKRIKKILGKAIVFIYKMELLFIQIIGHYIYITSRTIKNINILSSITNIILLIHKTEHAHKILKVYDLVLKN
ncbi:hypothetical protein H312_00627 [Anncaliia algerae PRA339]|uniref:ISXO2-like transposase domain-containing protein n=1 Tax=Anncaliia algerae PRA339 TaxID=1288291 RepID=A0A059F4R2_9MICR|nr:hypothetical protein H312_00627 [Anncaliia algerae PRA339]